MPSRRWLLGLSASLLASALLTTGCGRASRACEGCNVVLVSIDTLRADRLGVYGAGRPTSPQIDAFAQRAVVFDNAIAQAPTTLPSHMSILTGLYPRGHGVVDPRMRLSDETVTLAGALRRYGYRTAAFTGGGYVRPAFNYHGFDRFEHSAFDDVDRSSERVLFEEMIAWLEEGVTPFFLFWHTYRVHSPYLPAAEFDRFAAEGYSGPVELDPRTPSAVCAGRDPRCGSKGRFYFDYLIDQMGPADIRYVLDKYDGEILSVSSTFARLLEALERSGVRDDTVVVVASDHGESFGDRPRDRRVGHGLLYQEIVRVPLIVHLPGMARQQRVSGLVENVDIMPTLLALVGAPVPEGLDGRDLFAGGREVRTRGHALTEYPARGMRAVVLERFKVIETRSDEGVRFEIYDLEEDPGELRDLFGTGHPLESTLLALLESTGGDPGLSPAEGVELDDDVLRDLRALGYVN